MAKPVYVPEAGGIINFPDEATPKDIVAYVDRVYGGVAAAAPEPTGPDDSTILGRAAYGFATGLTDIPSGIASLFVPAEKVSETAAGKMSDDARKYLQETFGVDPTKDPTTSQQLAEVVGNIGSFLVPATGAAKVASLAGKAGKAASAIQAANRAAKLAKVAGTTTAAAQGAALGASARTQRIEQQLASGMEINPEEQLAAQRLDALVGTLEAAPLSRFFGPLNTILSKVPAAKAPIVEKIVQSRLASITKAGAAEGAQEVASGIANDLVEYGVYNPDVEIGQDILSNAGTGAFAGSLVESLIQIAAGRKLAPYRQLQSDLAAERSQNLAASKLGAVSNAAERLRQLNVEGPVEVNQEEIDNEPVVTIKTRAGNIVGALPDIDSANQAIDLYQKKTGANVRIVEPVKPPDVFPVKIAGQSFGSMDDVINTQMALRDRLAATTEFLADAPSVERNAKLRGVAVEFYKKQIEKDVKDIMVDLEKLDQFVGVASPTPPEPVPAADIERDGFLRGPASRGEPLPPRTEPDAVQEAEAVSPIGGIDAIDTVAEGEPVEYTDAVSEPEAAVAQPAVSLEEPIDSVKTPIPVEVEADGKQSAGPLPDAVKIVTPKEAKAIVSEPREYTPEQKAYDEQLRGELKKRLDSIATPEVKLELKEMIDTLPGYLVQGNVPSNGEPNGVATVVELSKGIFNPDLTIEQHLEKLLDVLNHEIIHIVRRQLRPVEWRALSRAVEVTKVPGKKYTYLDRAQAVYTPNGTPISKDYENPDSVVEEAVAEMYKDWVRNRQAPPQTRGAFNRITEFFRRIFRAIKSSNYEKAFRAIESGEVRGREIQPQQDGAGTKFSSAPLPHLPEEASEKGPTFFSSVISAINESKQSKMSGSQWLGYLRNRPGIKSEELKWLDLEDILPRVKGLLTKSQLLDVVRFNQIRVNDVVIGPPEKEKEFAGKVRRLFELDERSRTEGDGALSEQELAEMASLAEEYKKYEGQEPFYRSMVLDGGLNYRELLLTVPGITKDRSVQKHFSGFDDVVASVRFDERRDSRGGKVLFINEIQSDLQQNREIDAPFKTSWPELTLKRMVRWASENGFDAVAWPSTASQVAEIEKWGDGLSKKGDRFRVYEMDVTPVVNRYLVDLPRSADKLYGKFGTKTAKDVVSGGYEVNILPIPNEMRSSVMRGQSLFSAAPLPSYIETKNDTLFAKHDNVPFHKMIFDFLFSPSATGKTMRTAYGDIDISRWTQAGLAGRAALVDKNAAVTYLEKLLNQKMTGNFERMIADDSATAALAMRNRSSHLTAAMIRMGRIDVDYGRPGDILSATMKVTEDEDSLLNVIRILMEPGPVDSRTNKQKDKREVFKSYAVAMRAKNKKAAGLSVPGEVDDNYIRSVIPFTEQNYPEVVEAYKMYQRFNKKLLEAAVKTGLIKQTELNNLTRQMDYYGFYHEVYDTAMVPGMATKTASQFKLRPYKGSTFGNLVNDPVFVMIQNAQFWVDSMAKNLATTKAFNVAKLMGEARLLGTGEDPDEDRGEQKQVMFYKKDGVQQRFAVKDPLLVTALGSSDSIDLGGFMKILGLPTEIIRESVTRDPGFMVANLLRDTLSSWITSGEDITPFIGTMRGFKKALKKESSFQALMGRGVVGSYDLAMLAPADLATKMGRIATPKNVHIVPNLEAGVGAAVALWDRLGALSEASDAATRIAVYEAALAQGLSEAEASFRAIEIMDFSRRGGSAVMSVLTKLIPFLNARVQGLDVLYQAGRAGFRVATGQALGERDANLGKKFLIRGGMLAALSMVLEMWNTDDEDYQQLDEYIKTGNLLIPLKWLGMEGEFLAIPKPFEAGLLFSTFPQQFYKTMVGDASTRENISLFTTQFGATFGVNFVPQAVLPLAEAVWNIDFYTGLPLISEGKARLAPELQYNSGTSTIAMMLGNIPVKYNLTTGKFEGISPIVIENLISGYTGPIGSMIVQSAGVLMDSMSVGPERLPTDLTKLPVVKRVFIDAEKKNPKVVTQAYELFQIVDEANRSFSRLKQMGDVEAVKTFLDENRDVLAYRKYVFKMVDGLNKLNARERQIERDAEMTSDEKREAMVKLRELRMNIASKVGEINEKLGR